MRTIVLQSFLLLILTLISINATADSLPEDSLVCLPKTTMIQVIQDLESGDSCKEEAVFINANYAQTKLQLSLSEQKYKEMKDKYNICKNDNTDKDLIIEDKDKQINLKDKEVKKYKRQKNGLIGGGTTIVVILICLTIFL